MKTPDDLSAAPEARIIEIPRAQLVPWEAQPRQSFDAGELAELRQSIKEHGFWANFPLLVRRKNRLQIVERECGNFVPSQMPGEPREEWEKRILAGVEERMGKPPMSYCLEEGTPGGNWRERDVYFLREEAEVEMMKVSVFEIIDGERRWRVAGEEKISLLPCVLANIGDQKALEMALISSLQKVGLNMMEEAEGYRRLLEFRDEAGKPTYTPKSLAEKVGKSEQVVGRRVMLCKLRGTDAAKAVACGELPEYQAYLLSRLPTVELRTEWTKKVLKNPWGASPMPRAQLEQKLKDDVMKELRGADFDGNDPLLLPVVQDEETGARKLGGACTDCPFNTRNMETDEASAKGRLHMCMHPVCYRAKEGATHERWRGEWTNPAKNVETLGKEENDKLWADSGTALVFNSAYVELDEKPHEGDLKPTAKNVGLWKELVKGVTVPVIVARDEKGKAHKLVRRELAIAAAVENKHRIFKGDVEPAVEAQPGADNRIDAAAESMHAEAAAADVCAETVAKNAAASVEAAAREIERERVWMAQTGAVAEAMSAAKQPPEGFFRILFEVLGDCFLDGLCVASGRRGVDSEDFGKTLVEGNDGSYAAALVEVLVDDAWWSNGQEAGDGLLRKFAKVYGVDLKYAEKGARQALKVERAAAAEAAEIGEGMVWKWRREDLATGEEFRFNSSQIAENAERCELQFPKGLKVAGSVSMAHLPALNEWVMGWFVQGPKMGTSEPCAANGVKYGSRELALRSGLKAIEQEMVKGGVAEDALKRVRAWMGGSSGHFEQEGAEGAEGKGKKRRGAKAQRVEKEGGSK